MWTTSSSRVSAILTGVVCAGLGACQPTSPSSPGAAGPEPAERPPTVEHSQLRRPIVLRSVAARRMDGATKASLAEFGKTARDPIVIEVRLAEPVDMTPRTSSPVILLNGQTLPDTWVYPERPDTLVAYLADRTLIKDRNTVHAAWLGNEEMTMSRQGLTFGARDVR
jgi:hypothetical protein